MRERGEAQRAVSGKPGVAEALRPRGRTRPLSIIEILPGGRRPTPRANSDSDFMCLTCPEGHATADQDSTSLDGAGVGSQVRDRRDHVRERGPGGENCPGAGFE